MDFEKEEGDFMRFCVFLVYRCVKDGVKLWAYHAKFRPKTLGNKVAYTK